MTADSILGIFLLLAFTSPPVADGLGDECPTPTCPGSPTVAAAPDSHPDLLAPRNVLGPSDPAARPAPPESEGRYADYVSRQDFELEVLNDPSLWDTAEEPEIGEVYVTPEVDLISAARARVAKAEATDLFAIKGIKPRKRDGRRKYAHGPTIFGGIEVAR